MKPIKLLVLLTAALASLSLRALADDTAFTGTFSSADAGYGLNALVFTIDSPITVDSLGFYAYALNGSTDSPEIDLYSVVSAGPTTVATQLATTGPVTPFPPDYTNGQWNYYSITPLTLAAGTYMVAGGLYWAPVFTGVTYDSDLTTVTSPSVETVSGWNGFNPNNYATGGTPPAYDFTLTSGAAAGVNFEFTPASVIPEPSSYALVGLGLAGFVGWRLLRRRTVRA